MTPTPVLDPNAVQTLISAGGAAPSIHNTQPWRFTVDPQTRTVTVHAAWERSLPLADAKGRALHVSVGAAIFNLMVAARHLEWEPILHLLPRSSDPGLLAEVRMAGPPLTGRTPGPDLYEAIAQRRSSRLPFTGCRVPPAVVDELTAAARTEGAELSLPGAAESARLLELTADAELRRTTDHERLHETRSWLREPDKGPYGVPYTALGPRDARAHVPMRDFTGQDPVHWQPSAAFEEHPKLALLSTCDDRAADWLRAGQALEHVLLLLTSHGLRASMLYQALEWHDLRWLLRDPLSPGLGQPQMLLRIGYGPQGPPTPRRPAQGTPTDG